MLPNLKNRLRNEYLNASRSLFDMFCVGMDSQITIALKRPKAINMEIKNFKGDMAEVLSANLLDMFRDFWQQTPPKGFTKFGILFALFYILY